jgi:hypothetical protein
MTPGCRGKQIDPSKFGIYTFQRTPHFQLSRLLSKPQDLGTLQSCDAAIERFNDRTAFTWTGLDRKHTRTSSPQHKGRARIFSTDDRAKHVQHNISP